jgi:hypothetical protein
MAMHGLECAPAAKAEYQNDGDATPISPQFLRYSPIQGLILSSVS